MAPQRILVTGGSGFIGSHLVRRLVAEGHEVSVLHRCNSDLGRLRDLSSSLQFHAGDLLDTARLAAVFETARPAVIFHLAGNTSLRHIDPDLAGVTESVAGDVRASINVFLAAQKCPQRVSLLVRAGGLEEYGNGPVPYHETQREQPISPYSASQAAATHYLQMLAPHLSYRAVTVRPALIYGPAQSVRFFIPSLIEHCLEGRDFSMSAAECGRDVMHVDDLVRALLLLLEKPLPTGEILNLGSGCEYRMRDVADMIVRLTGAKIQISRKMPARPGDLEHLYCSARKAKEMLDWEAKIGLEDGLRHTIASFQPARASQ